MSRVSFAWPKSLAHRAVHLAVLGALAAPLAAAQAGTVIVTSNADAGGSCPDATQCTLRDAIASAASGDTVVFADDMTITLASPLTIGKDLSIDGTGHTVGVDGNHAVGVFAINDPVAVQITHLVVQNGRADYGAGIFNKGSLTVVDSRLTGNSATVSGGAIHGDFSGAITLVRTTLSGNSAVYNGGGINSAGSLGLTDSSLVGNSANGRGGGLSNYGQATLTATTLAGNSVGGGALYSGSGTTLLSNSTVSGNSSAGKSGGILNYAGNVSLTHCTLANNTGTTAGGDVYSDLDDTITLTNVVLADGCAGAAPAIDNGGNLDGGTSCGFIAATSQSNVTLALGPLGDHGGATQTLLPGAGSAAIDAIDCTNAPALDQRGVPRPQGTQCDAGAVEAIVPPPDRLFGDGFGPPPFFS